MLCLVQNVHTNSRIEDSSPAHETLVERLIFTIFQKRTRLDVEACVYIYHAG